MERAWLTTFDALNVALDASNPTVVLAVRGVYEWLAEEGERVSKLSQEDVISVSQQPSVQIFGAAMKKHGFVMGTPEAQEFAEEHVEHYGWLVLSLINIFFETRSSQRKSFWGKAATFAGGAILGGLLGG